MKMVSLLTLILCLLFPLTVFSATGVHATHAGESVGIVVRSGQKNTQQLKIKTKEQAIQLVKQHYQGQVLKVQSSQIGGHPGYKVKLISKGLVFYVSVDAQTGSIRKN